MSWLARYRVRQYVNESVWLPPTITMIFAVAISRILADYERASGAQGRLDPNTALVILTTLASSMFTLIVFVCSVLLVAVQIASSQLTPRIIALVFRDPVTRIGLIAFIFTFTFTLSALAEMNTAAYPLTTHVAGYSCLLSLALFFYMIDHVGRTLRPSGVMWHVAAIGRRVIRYVYPHRLDAIATSSSAPAHRKNGLDLSAPLRTILNRRDGAVLAFDTPGLVTLAKKHNCVIELVPQVGDFVARDEPLFRIHHGGENLPEKLLHESIALGQERTLKQDPAFAFRIIVDIANKGLSPAINDPTTAVLAIDQIHHLLREVGRRQLDDERVVDSTGKVRLAYRTPNWEDFVQLAVTEIRMFGSSSIQVTRRLHAMLDNLIETLPPQRALSLRRQLAMLHRSAQRCFAEPEDRVLADVSDAQGVGAPTKAPPASTLESPPVVSHVQTP